MFPALPCATVSSLAATLSLASELSSLRLAQRAHACALVHGLHAHPVLAASLISSYSRLALPSLSLLVFLSSPSHLLSSPFLSNSLLSAFSRNSLFLDSLLLFNRFRSLVSPDDFTLSILAKASAVLSDLSTGSAIHSLAFRLGFASDTVVSNSIMVLYFKCGCPCDARKVFDEMAIRSAASWNALISELVDFEGQVWKLVVEMQMEGWKPDGITVSVVLPVCGGSIGGYRHGREIHGFVVRHAIGLGSDFHVGSCLLDMYSRAKRVDIGRRVFDGMVSRNVVAWTSMIGGYVENREFEEALVLFRTMQLQERLVPNKVTLVTILPAVGSIASLMEGKQIHGFTIRAFLSTKASLNNALIDMYSKCGNLDSARSIFDDNSWNKDVISWSSMISCYGIHGRGEETLFMFNEMCSHGIKLDCVASVGLLSACVRSGLVNEGIKIFYSLVEDHGVHPTGEICSCVVNLLGRAGLLTKALDFIRSMPSASGPSVWGALFEASVVHNDGEIQDLAYRSLIQLEPENASNYITLSNLYAASGKWDFVADLRTRMKQRQMRKIPGCSWIKVNNEVHSFCVADKSHQYMDMIYTVLDGILLTMKGDIDVPDLDS